MIPRGRLPRGSIRLRAIIAGTLCAADAFARILRPAIWTRFPLEHPDPSQLERLQAEHSSKEVRTGLARLPDRARMALVLRYYADMSYEEIADTLGVRRAFVGVLLLRARHQLRDALSEAAIHNFNEPLQGVRHEPLQWSFR